MPRRPVSQRATALLAACLRGTATFAQRAAQRLDGTRPAAPDPIGPAAVGGPPEHWRAMVAQRAPGLLRGAGLGTSRVPAAQPRPAWPVSAESTPPAFGRVGSADEATYPTDEGSRVARPATPATGRDRGSRRWSVAPEVGTEDQSGADDPSWAAGLRVVPTDDADAVADIAPWASRRAGAGVAGRGIGAAGRRAGERNTGAPGRDAASLLSRVRVAPDEPPAAGRAAGRDRRGLLNVDRSGADQPGGPDPSGWTGPSAAADPLAATDPLSAADPLAAGDPVLVADPLGRARVAGRTADRFEIADPPDNGARYAELTADRRAAGRPDGSLPSRRRRDGRRDAVATSAGSRTTHRPSAGYPLAPTTGSPTARRQPRRAWNRPLTTGGPGRSPPTRC